MKRWNRFSGIIAVTMLLCSCNLLPRELEHDTSLLLSSYEVDYEYVLVQKGTLAHKEKVVCSYMAFTQEDYGFVIAGEPYGKVYVKQGDRVKKGDLLAELYVEDYLSSIQEARAERDKLILYITYLKKKADAAVQKQLLKLQELSQLEQQFIPSAEEIRWDYDCRIHEGEYKIAVLNNRIHQWEQEVEKRRIYTSVDGIVSYLKPISSGHTSYGGSKFITISDDKDGYFYAKTGYAGYFVKGSEMTIQVDKEEYLVRVVESSKLGIEETDHEVYFELVDSGGEIGAGEKGTTIITIDKRENVLYVAEEAITVLDQQPVIFYLNEDGIRDYKEVSTGFSADGYIEIMNGVNEGDHVIVG